MWASSSWKKKSSASKTEFGNHGCSASQPKFRQVRRHSKPGGATLKSTCEASWMLRKVPSTFGMRRWQRRATICLTTGEICHCGNKPWVSHKRQDILEINVAARKSNKTGEHITPCKSSAGKTNGFAGGHEYSECLLTAGSHSETFKSLKDYCLQWKYKLFDTGTIDLCC